MPFLFGLMCKVFLLKRSDVEYSSRNPCRSGFDEGVGVFDRRKTLKYISVEILRR